MPGPLPNPQARRRNAPTVNGSTLPAAGRKGNAPKCPYQLGDAGKAWWRWAWKLPQATKWDKGSHYALGRRAQLEDMMAELDSPVEFDLDDILATLGDDGEMLRRLQAVITKMKSLSGGTVSIMREMRELDNRFGLNAKSMADLRWTIGEVEAKDKPAAGSGSNVRRLQAVDPSAVARG